MFILEELLSPIVTPLILIFCLRPRALEIIDFFRNFTVEVVGVGDTCSFAQMDVRQHGHPQVLGKEGGGQLARGDAGIYSVFGQTAKRHPSEPTNHKKAALPWGNPVPGHTLLCKQEPGLDYNLKLAPLAKLPERHKPSS